MGAEERAFIIVERKKLRLIVSKYHKAHPERALRITDNSHFGYVLVTNSELPVQTASNGWPPPDP